MIKQNSLGEGFQSMPELYIDKSDINFNNSYLSEENYAEAISALVVVCVDIIFINRENNSIFLAKRKAKPANDKWWLTGGRCSAGEDTFTSAKRILKRETDLVLEDTSRLEFFGMFRYFFANRQQVPQNVGSDSLTYTFLFEPTQQELSKINLDQNEYWGTNLTEFKNLTELEKSGVTDPVLTFYKKIYNLV